MTSINKMTQLEYLSLRQNHLTAAAAKILVNTDHLFFLQFLDVSDNELGDSGATLLANFPDFYPRVLEMENNNIGPDGALGIERSQKGFFYVCLNRNHLGAAGAAIIAKTFFDGFGISSNQIGDEGALAILNNSSNQIGLDASDNQLTNKGVAALTKMFDVEYLNVSHNQIDDASVIDLQQIGKWENNKIIYLDVSYNHLSQKGINILAHTKNIARLYADGNDGLLVNKNQLRIKQKPLRSSIYTALLFLCQNSHEGRCNPGLITWLGVNI